MEIKNSKRKVKITIAILVSIVSIIIIALCIKKSMISEMRAVILKVEEKNLYVESLEKTGHYRIYLPEKENTNFRQGQEILVYYSDKIIPAISPAPISDVEKIEVIKDQSNELDESTLKWLNHLWENMVIDINSFTTTGIELTITDNNDTPYPYILKDEFEVIVKTDKVPMWEEAPRNSNNYDYNDIKISENSTDNVFEIICDWNEVYGELAPGEYQFKIYSKESFDIAIDFTVNEDATIEYKHPFTGEKIKAEKEIMDWELTLVNYENQMTEDFEVELSNIDSIRKFDSRAINNLNQMILDMKKQGLRNIWIQSAYRTIEEQENLFNDKVNYFLSIGKTEEEAENLTLRMINRPGTSEHNLGLAVDFNYVNKDFENTKEFAWLLENAENYGFVLRYKAEKIDITKVYYEPWHWRYVGIEHAKKMNELDMCLEEYIEYLKNI